MIKPAFGVTEFANYDADTQTLRCGRFAISLQEFALARSRVPLANPSEETINHCAQGTIKYIRVEIGPAACAVYEQRAAICNAYAYNVPTALRPEAGVKLAFLI